MSFVRLVLLVSLFAIAKGLPVGTLWRRWGMCSVPEGSCQGFSGTELVTSLGAAGVDDVGVHIEVARQAGA